MEAVVLDDNKILCCHGAAFYYVEVGGSVNMEITPKKAFKLLEKYKRKEHLSDKAWWDNLAHFEN